uniref:HELP domain-containing protein n=1 Tax=Romanomermis culicivorax TaxID=13658 RepID=A0A915IDZ2_ROMCU
MPDRVVYLERKVQEQEIEIKHLRNIVDGLSKKVSSFFVADPDSYSSCSLSKSLSRSYANLSSNRNLTRPFSGSTFSIGRFSENNDLLVMSTYSSPSCVVNRNNLETNSQFLTGKVGLPCKIYQKNANGNGANGKTTENRVGNTKVRSFSALNLRAPPKFFPDENLWKFFIGHRCVNVYGPSSSIDDEQLKNLQSKNLNDNHKFSANFEGRDKAEEEGQQQQQGKENNKTKIRSEIIFNSAEEKKAKSLKVEWIYGYRGRDCRSNLHFLPTGELAYNLGTAIVLFNTEENCQRHFLDHTAEIKCLCMHPNRLLLASGQLKSHGHTIQNTANRNIIPNVYSAHIRIWDSIKLKTVKILGAAHFEKFPCCLSFSKANGGVHLAAIEDTIDHPITIWDWQYGRKVAETKTGNDPVFALEFHTSDKTLLISCGKS